MIPLYIYVNMHMRVHTFISCFFILESVSYGKVIEFRSVIDVPFVMAEP